MKAVTRYLADDGSQWNTEAEAQARDALCARVTEAMSALRARPRTLDAGNGDVFLQQDREKVLAAKQAIVDLALEVTKHDVFRHPAFAIHPQSIAGRILDNTGGPLARAWWRFACIDDLLREWDQPYFVSHPNEKATAVS